MALLPNEKLITTKEAGELSGYTSDYLSRLVRSGKIAGKKVGHSWLVDKESLNRFLGEQDDHKSDRARELARARAREYRVHRSVVLRAAKALTEPRSMPQQFVRMMSALPSRAALRRLRSHALALSVALLVLTFGTLGAQAEMLPRFAQNAAAVAEQTALGLEATFGDIPSHIAQRFTDVEREMRTHFSRTATTGTAASARIAPRVLRNLSVSLSFGQPETTSSDRAAFSIRAASASKAAVPAVTASDIRAFAADAYAVFTSPSRVTDAAANAYVSVGEEAYGAIRAALAAYRSTLDEFGARTLSAAAAARDTLRAAPEFVARTNLALGESVIAAARFVLDAEIAASYGLAAAAPASARATVALVGGTGDLLAGFTVRAAVEAPSRLARAILDASEAGAKIPEAVFSAEYAAATGFIAATNAVSGRYALALALLGEVGYESARGSRALVQSIPEEIRHPRQLQPSDLEHAGAALASAFSDAYRGSVALVLRSLGEVGRTPKVAAVLNSPPMRALESAGEAGLAAALPALSAGEKAALAIYTAIHGLFTFTTDSLANLFMPPPTIVYPVAAPARPRVVATPAPRTFNSYTTIVRGVSEDFVQQSLNSLRSSLLATIADSIRPVYMQTVTNAGTIQMVNKIEDLHDLIVRNGDFRNSIFDNGIRVSATDGRFTNLYGGSASLTSLTVSGATSLATTTVTGDLSVSGSITPSIISAGDYIRAPYFVATSTTATSTFAGSLAIDTNGFVYATSTKNVGIGVLSPAALLAVQNSTSTQPIFVASSAAGAEVYRITNAGFVGIGTTTPGYNLAVEGSSSLGNQAIAGYFTATTSTATSTFAGVLAIGTTTPYGNGLFTVGTTTPLLYIDRNSGKIGIGTSSPSTNLGLVGSQYLTGGLGVGVLNTGAGTLQTSGAATIGGNLTVSGTLTNLQQASTTLFSANSAYFGSTATSTFSTNGSLTLPTVALLTAPYASTTMVTATTASTTNLIASAGVTFQNLIGMLSSNGTSGTSARTLTGTANQITITNGDGTGGNPTFSLPSLLSLTNASTSQLSVFQRAYFGGTSTTTIDSAGSITLPTVALLTAPYASTTMVTATTASSTNLIASASVTFQNLVGMLSSNGTSGTSARTLTGTTNQITIANGDGTGGNPTFSLPSLLFITNASSTALSSLDYVSVGRTATTTFVGDYGASSVRGSVTVYGDTTSGAGSSFTLQRGSTNGDNSLIFNDQTGSPLLKLYTSANTGYSYLNGQQSFLSLGMSVGGEVLRIDTSNNARFTGNVIPSANQQYNLGTTAVYWNNAYINNIVANNLSSASTSIAGTNTTSFSINSNNPTSDAQDMSLIFYRGAGAPSNAVLSWNSTLKRFEFNQNAYIANASASTGSTTLRVAAVAGQTGALTSWLDSSGNVLSAVTASGNIGVGTSTPYSKLTAWGTGSLFEAVTNASTTVFSVGQGGATSTSLFAGRLTANTFSAGQTASTTIDSAGNLATAGTFSATGLSSLAFASSTLFSANQAYFGATATSSFSNAGVLTLATDLAVTEGGTGASTLTGLLQGNGTSAITGITNSSTAGQVLRVTGASTYAWGALDLADTDAITGDLPFANLAQVSANSVLGNITGSTADAASIATSSLFTWSGTGDVVRTTSPTLVTPTLGVASATSLNKLTITTPATSATLTILDGKTLTTNNSLTLAGTDGTTLTFQGTDTYVGRATTDTLTNKTLTSPVVTGGTFTGLQQLAAASTTLLSAYGPAYFGATATSTFDSAGNLSVGGTLTVAGLCVTGDTRLRRRRKARKGEEGEADEDGYIYDEVAIKDVKEGDEIQSLDLSAQAGEKTGKLVWSKVKQLAYMGKKQTYRLTTASGKTISTTANHPYLARKGHDTIDITRGNEHLTRAYSVSVDGGNTTKRGSAGRYLGATGAPNSAAQDRVLPNLRGRIYAFIDASNVYHAARREGWEVDYEKLHSYFTHRYGVSRIFFFAGTTHNPERAGLYTALLRFGYELILVLTRRQANGQPKADVDSAMTFEMMRRESEFDAAVVMTGDGDYYDMLKHLVKTKSWVRLLSTTKSSAGELRELFGSRFIHLNSLRHLIARDELFNENEKAETTFVSASGEVPREYTKRGYLSSASQKDVDNLVKHGEGSWLKVSELKEGMEIAVADSTGSPQADGASWERIVSVEPVAEEDVYDIEVEGTHNFIGNDIVAHNTAIFNQASSTLFSANQAYFGATATSSFSSAGVLSLATDLAVTEGGTGASTLTGLLQGNGTSAITGITNSSTAGQVLRVTGASTYAWGALDLADTDAITGDLPFANLAQVSANSVLGNITGSTADAASIATSSLFTWSGTGDVVRTTSPTLVTPALGTPSALVLTNATGLPVGGGGTGLSSVGDGQLLFGSGGTTALTALATSTGGFLTNSYTTGRPSWVATSTLFGTGTGGQILAWNAGVPQFVATTTIPLAGDVGGTLSATVIGANKVTLGMLATLAANSVIGNLTGSTATPTAVATSSLFTWSGTGLVVRDTSPTIATPTFTGLSTFAFASSTLFSANQAYFGATATSTFTSAGRLGILNSSPSYPIDVTGDVNISLGSNYKINGANLSPGSWVASGNDVYNSNSGNIGIGTTTPYSRLSVWGGGTGATAMFELTNSASTTLASVLNDGTVYMKGNVGIGTTTPAGKLDVAMGVSTYARFGGVSGARIVKIGNDSSGYAQIQSISGVTGAVTDLSLQLDGGNVGIGTTGPFHALTVAGNQANAGTDNLAQIMVVGGSGNTNARLLLGYDTTNSKGYIQAVHNNDAAKPLLLNPSGGNVGIGTTSPAALLNLSGASPRQIIDDTGTSFAALDFRANGTAQRTTIGVENAAGGGLFVGSSAYASVFGSAGASVTQFASNNTVRMTIDTSGNVGIGTTGPVSTLQVYTPGADDITQGLTVGGGNLGLHAYFDTAGWTNTIFSSGYDNAGSKMTFRMRDLGTDVDAVTILGSGNVGIGTTGPGSNLDILQHNGVGALTVTGQDSLATTYNLSILNSSSAVVFRAYNDGKVIIPTGNVGIGTTSPATLLEVGGSTANVTFDGYKSCTGFTSDGNGKLACTASDQRLKNNIQAMSASSSLAALRSLAPVSFYWRDASPSGLEQYGFIAQDVVNVFPNLVQTTNPTELTPGGTMTVNYIGLIAPMIGAIQALDAKLGPLAGVLSVVPGVESQCVTGDTKLRRRRRKKGIATLADGDPCISEGSNSPGLGTSPSVANGVSVSSTTEGLVDNLLKPVEGIEPSASGIPSPELSQTTGWNQVYDDDAYVYDEIEIKNVVAGDEIQSLDEATGRVVYSRVNALVDMGTQEVFELVTKSGRRIRTTSNHPFLARIAAK